MADDAFDENSYPFHELCADPEFEYEFLLREWILEHPILLWEWQEERENQQDWETGETLLHYAARFREADMVRRMLEHGVNPNVCNRSGMTPLLYLGDSDLDYSPNKVLIMQLLLEHGADPNQADNLGVTPLHNTYHFWDLAECHSGIDLLVAYGADPNKPDAWGRTPLYEGFRCETLRVLIGHGAAVNHIDNNGVSPLVCASSCCSPDAVETLLACGADPNLCTNTGNAPLHFAAREQGFHPTLKALLQAGGDPHHRNEDGNTPLHVAASVHAFESVSLLQEAGANVNARNHQSMTALTLVEQEIDLGRKDGFALGRPVSEDLYSTLSIRQRKTKMLTLLRKSGGRT